MNRLLIMCVFTSLLHQGVLGQSTQPSSKIIELKIKPSSTDETISAADVPHLVWYNSLAPQG